MENELDYLSEKIESLDCKIAGLYDTVGSGFVVGARLGRHFKGKISEMKKEKQLLENILTAITFSEIKRK